MTFAESVSSPWLIVESDDWAKINDCINNIAIRKIEDLFMIKKLTVSFNEMPKNSDYKCKNIV